MQVYIEEASSINWLRSSLRSNSGSDLIDVQVIYTPDDERGFKYKILYKKKDIVEDGKTI